MVSDRFAIDQKGPVGRSEEFVAGRCERYERSAVAVPAVKFRGVALELLGLLSGAGLHLDPDDMQFCGLTQMDLAVDSATDAGDGVLGDDRDVGEYGNRELGGESTASVWVMVHTAREDLGQPVRR